MRYSEMETMSTLHPVQPVRPVAPYLGGKRNLARRIARMAADLIVAEARADGFGFRSGHHVSTSTTALSRTLALAAEVFITTHMHSNNASD